ncbi:MAG TPA: cbb3-type cytochrome c oxidase subunit I [Steroidobacteraceae bacterium]|nr:cbb3-type cytochrome c oxidase subunit I [Steroidobacteraceae bacterium]
MSVLHLVFGRLTVEALPFWEMLHYPTRQNIVNGAIATTAACIVLGGAGLTALLITRYRKWRALWTGWLTSVDHKRIGIMYIVIAFVMLARALIEANIMRGHMAFALGGGFLSAGHFEQFFTTHGTIMIFFMAMPFLTGLINFVMPLQIGARDVAFPVMNSVSLGLTAAGAALVMISLDLGKFSTGGWSGYPPYTETAFNAGVGVDYWIWAVSLSSLGSMMTGINFAVTVYKKRAPGMRFMRMPLFTWTALCTSILMIFAMPPLTVATGLLALDRYLGFHFFTDHFGGNFMNYVNLFWLFGHPEVYILILPSFGVYSEVFSTFSGKTLYGYTSLVLATMAIGVLSFTVWLHHFFTMGQSANINAVFGIATMLIGVPTGVKVYDWIWTMFRGRVRFTVPLVYALAFSVLFVLGGMTGVILANPSIDFQVHNTQFLIAHFHNMLVPGTLFGLLAGYHMWFPKAFGFRLDERWGLVSALCFIFGFILAFFPLYALGLLGYPRRTLDFFDPVYRPYMIVAFIGALTILTGLAGLVIQLVVSIRRREQYAVPAGDPWDGRSLEWSVPAPPPEYNFPVVPVVSRRDAFTGAKEDGTAYRPPERFYDMEMPKNSAMGVIVCAGGFFAAFGLVWYIWWMVVAASLGILAAVVGRGFVRDTERIIPAHEVERRHLRWLATVAVTQPVSRGEEATPSNAGLAAAPVLESAE